LQPAVLGRHAREHACRQFLRRCEPHGADSGTVRRGAQAGPDLLSSGRPGGQSRSCGGEAYPAHMVWSISLVARMWACGNKLPQMRSVLFAWRPRKVSGRKVTRPEKDTSDGLLVRDGDNPLQRRVCWIYRADPRRHQFGNSSGI
jgi:hypothetical protein